MNQKENTKYVFNSCATDYQRKFMDVDLYIDTFDIFCEPLTENAEILEIACGPGNITKYLLKQRPDLNIFGIDLAENMIALAKINNPKAKFEVMDCGEINQIDKKFDGIMCGFCLPYLSREEVGKLIFDASNLLNPEGVLYLSTMEDDYEKSGLKQSSDGKYENYQYFHEGHYLKQILEENGFKVTTLKRQNYPESGSSKTIDLIIVAQLQTKKKSQILN